MELPADDLLQFPVNTIFFVLFKDMDMDHVVWFRVRKNTLVICLDGQFPVTPVHQNGELNAGGPAKIHQSLHGSPDGPSGEKYVIH
jgi:hypothetical protein